jgi:hypothetical protein
MLAMAQPDSLALESRAELVAWGKMDATSVTLSGCNSRPSVTQVAPLKIEQPERNGRQQQ